MKCSDKERHKLIVQIGKAIDSGNDLLIEALGKTLKSYEEPAVRRGYFALHKYKPHYHESNLSKLTTTVYRCTHTEAISTYSIGLKKYAWFTTVEEFAKNRGIPITKAYHELMNLKDFKVEPIAEVFNENINQIVFVSDGKKIVDSGFYLDIALEYGIHFEDLNDCIEDKIEVKISNNIYKFSYNDGKEL